MSILTTGPIVNEIRGSVGSRTFSRNAYGPYVKNKLIQTNPDTPKQQNVRTNFAIAVSRWQNMSDSERRMWMSAAKDFPITDSLGQRKKLSGYNFYLKCAMSRFTYTADPPQPIFDYEPKVYVYSMELIEQNDISEIIYTSDSIFDNQALQIYYAEDRPLSITFLNPSLLKYATTIAPQQSGYIGVSTYWSSLFSKPFPYWEDRRAWIAFRSIDTRSGYASGLFTFQFLTSLDGYIFQTR